MAKEDLTGKKYGEWTVLGPAKPGFVTNWICQCVCGKIKTIVGGTLKKSKSLSCGCTLKHDISGQVFGSWTALKRSDRAGNNGKKNFWTCACVCGTTRDVAGATLKNGASSSCGCQSIAKQKKTTLSKYGVEFASQDPGFRDRVRNTCIEKYGVEVATQSKDAQAKSKATNLSRYGVEYSSQAPAIKEKKKKKSMEKYGVENVSQSLEIKEKKRQTNLEKYGTENQFQSDAVKEKSKQTSLQRYGVECPSSSIEVKAKIKFTMLQKYGVEYPSQSDIIMTKRKMNNLEKYGVEHTLQYPGIRESITKTLSENNYRSSGEMELSNYIESLGFKTSKTYCGGADPFEIDIKVADQNDNPLLFIEYNGDYFHSEARSGTRNYHRFKTDVCKTQKGFHLLHIFDSEWQTKQEIVKNFIRSKLEKGQSIRASKCEIRELELKDVKEFLNNNHLQGSPNHSILTLGLYCHGDLVSVMTFSKPHRQNMSSESHLSRYAIKPGIRVHGGLSKLSQYAFSKLGQFITFVHYRLSDGNSYLKSGYTQLGLSRPDYWYWDNKHDKVVSKQSRRKSVVNTPEGMTESEHAAQDNLYKVWDCGKIKMSYS